MPDPTIVEVLEFLAKIELFRKMLGIDKCASIFSQILNKKENKVL